MSLVIVFALQFPKTRELLIFSCCCTISIFLINYTEAQKAHCKTCLYVPLSVGLPAIILILTINQIHDGLLIRIVGACNTRQSVVTSLTLMSTCIICWWKTYLDCMNNNILSLTLCCDTHFIYWPQLDFCIDFTVTVCLWRFSMDFPAAIPTDPTWSLSQWPPRGKAWKMVIIFTISIYLAPVLYTRATQGCIVIPDMFHWPEKTRTSISTIVCVP